MKAGRNDDCPCGSGLKYKKCCQPKEADDRTGNRLFREMEAALMERMLPFADEVFGEGAIDQALALFLDDEGFVEFDAADPLNPFFLPWFLFNWTLEETDDLPSDTAPLLQTVAEAFLKAKGDQLSPETKELIHASNRRALSFYEILECVPGKSLKLFDLMLDASFEVDEDSASTSLRKGDIVIGSMMAPMSGRIRPLNLGPFALESKDKGKVVEMKAEMLKSNKADKINEELLHNQEAFVLGLYLDIIDEMLDENDEEDTLH